MTGRVIAWVVVLLVVWGSWVASKHWSNPWGVVTAAVPVTSIMPAMPDGCCKK